MYEDVTNWKLGDKLSISDFWLQLKEVWLSKERMPSIKWKQFKKTWLV